MQQTNYKHNQVVRIKNGFYRGSFLRLDELLENKKDDPIVKYKASFVRLSNKRFVDVTPKKTITISEDDIIKTFNFFGVYL